MEEIEPTMPNTHIRFKATLEALNRSEPEFMNPMKSPMDESIKRSEDVTTAVLKMVVPLCVSGAFLLP